MEIIDNLTYEESIENMYSDNWIDRYFAVKSLGNIGGDLAVKSLIDILESDEDGLVKVGAMKELGKLQNPLAIESLVCELACDSDSMKNHASVAICQICDISIFSPLLTMMGELKWSSRRKMIDILHEIHKGSSPE